MNITDIPTQYKVVEQDGYLSRGWLQFFSSIRQVLQGSWTSGVISETPYGVHYCGYCTAGEVVTLPYSCLGILAVSYDGLFDHIRVEGSSFTVPNVSSSNQIIVSGILRRI